MIKGTTIILADVSAAMVPYRQTRWGWRYDSVLLTLIGGLRDRCEMVLTATFSDKLAAVKPLSGEPLAQAIFASQVASGQKLDRAIEEIHDDPLGYYDRLVLVSNDAVVYDRLPRLNNRGYVINVASNKTGEWSGDWRQIDCPVSYMAHAIESLDHG